jgi:putative nucleotidyltransferase with HDIG domain
MNRLDVLKKEIDSLYTDKHPNADPWTSWSYPNHVLIVAKNADKVAKEQGANIEQCVSGALLHDIADAVMPRSSKDHEKESLRIANEILEKCGYTEKECSFIVSEIITPHSCSHTIPTTLEGKVLATADAMAHFQKDFFIYAAWHHFGDKDNITSFKEWVLTKIDKNFFKKIFFDEYRKEIESEYKALKLLFSK